MSNLCLQVDDLQNYKEGIMVELPILVNLGFVNQ